MSIKANHYIRTAFILLFAICIAALPANSGQVYAEDSGTSGFDWSRTAILALSTGANAVEIDGQTRLDIVNGDIYSNGGGVKSGASGQVTLTEGNILIALDNGWSCAGCGAGTVTPAPLFSDSAGQDLAPIALPQIPVPYCPSVDERYGGVSYYVHAGIRGSATLQPGIHCVDGDISLGGSDVLTGENVMIVMKNGAIKTSGSAEVVLKSSPALVDRHGYSWGGMLIYAPATNSSLLQIGGNSASFFSGTVFAPAAACEIGGSGPTLALRGQVICDTMKIHGGAEIQFIH